MASALRKWMRKEDIYDKDLESLLIEKGVEDPDKDFANIGAKDWDDLVRRGKVERFKELKDAASRNRLEKKIKKIEKVWRKQSGIKSTSIKKGGGKKKKKGDKKKDKSAPKGGDPAKKAPELKKYMQKNQVWEIELYNELCGVGITCEADIVTCITSNDDWDEIYRKVRVARTKDLKDTDAKLRMEALMTKFEKLWRKASGIKKTSVTKKTKKGGAKKTPKDAKIETMAGKGNELKKWMRKESIWENTLFEELLSNGIEDPEALTHISEKEFDEIIRTVRVARFKELKDQDSRNRCDKLLVSFEKIWRKQSGIKKTSIQD